MLSRKSGASRGHATIGNGGRSAWSGALQSTLDELGQDADGFRNCACRVCAAHTLARAALCGRRRRRARRYCVSARHVIRWGYLAWSGQMSIARTMMKRTLATTGLLAVFLVEPAQAQTLDAPVDLGALKR